MASIRRWLGFELAQQKEPEQDRFPVHIVCPKCGAVNKWEWGDSVAGIVVCLMCNYGAGLSEFEQDNPPGVVSVIKEEPV